MRREIKKISREKRGAGKDKDRRGENVNAGSQQYETTRTKQKYERIIIYCICQHAQC